MNRRLQASRYSPAAVSAVVHLVAVAILSVIVLKASVPPVSPAMEIVDVGGGDDGFGGLDFNAGGNSATLLSAPSATPTSVANAGVLAMASRPAELSAFGDSDAGLLNGSDFEGTGAGGGLGNGLGAGEGDGVAAGGGLIGAPSNAVRKGSFSAFTLPIGQGQEEPQPGDSPAEGQDYFIVIQIRLPEGRKSYYLSDLSGSVVGTDGYEQMLPGEAFLRDPEGEVKPIGRNRKLAVVKGRVQILVHVPGARAAVRDTIQIQSKQLKEKQKLELVFGEEEVASPGRE
jgi:hypothetical protein